MTPLNENEKRGIVEAYQALVSAIRKDAASATTKTAFEAFQWTYLGKSRVYVDMFPNQIGAPAGRDSWTSTCTIRSNPISGEGSTATHYRTVGGPMPSSARVMPAALDRIGHGRSVRRLRVFS